MLASLVLGSFYCFSCLILFWGVKEQAGKGMIVSVALLLGGLVPERGALLLAQGKSS